MGYKKAALIENRVVCLKMNMKLIHVVGARPNFMKAGPVLHALAEYQQVNQILVHTGQHYDANMSEIFFKQLGLPEPDINLEVGSGSHARQTADIMVLFEQVVQQERPDLVLVYGDVNSTVAAAIVCAKLHIPVGHVEAGLRSFDRRMPEEINRLLTDQISDLLFTPSIDGNENLMAEGVAEWKIHFVGNVMIDTLVRLLPAAEARWPALQAQFGLERFGLVTLHRPSNVDDLVMLDSIMETLEEIGGDVPLLFPAHPRTRRRLEGTSFERNGGAVKFIAPMGYIDFLALQRFAALVITDSGGIQEETTFLNTPCLTVRENTERPVTVTMGTNVLVGQDMGLLRARSLAVLNGERPEGKRPPLWDGKAGERIAKIIVEEVL
jgi:UDP-N-acetylglucosamine 2-epimerase (non-hydrolysing)